MEKSKAAKLVINVEDTSKRRSKRKSDFSPKKTPPNKQLPSQTVKKLRSKKDWRFIILKERWFPSKITTSDSKVQIEICDLVPTEAEMAMSYMDGVQHNKPIQPEFSRGSRRKKIGKGKSVDLAHISEESVPLVTDIGVRQAHITDDDDDFVDPPRRCEVEKLQPVVDKKGKGKVDLTDDVAFSCSLQPPSFDLGIRYTQPNDLQSAEIQKQIDVAITNVITASKNVDEEGSPTPELASELPVKWVLRPARILSLHLLSKKERYRGMTNKIKDIFPTYQKDPHVLFSESSLIKAVIGHMISLSTSWADVDYVFMPLLPTNKAHWMLGLVEFRSHTVMLFNSPGKTYCDWKMLESIESYVKVLPALMKALGISKKDPDYNESECKQMKVTIDCILPQQTNGCSIPHQFDATKCRLDIASLLYKHQKPYVKKVR
ncbi:sentrin-specific protease 1-like [Olea europaea subsp. europaea]|uniref:Sentrin-specific protease 1-like n=1 Tax=Olea europaea subsp. europaea TaxID=158383 RepID=A0A8S0S4A0_OLEEU|nr:sentrin-specific protease 1-like [Olea europaea subsp. europaea]